MPTEETMPHVIVKLYAGKSEQQKIEQGAMNRVRRAVVALALLLTAGCAGSHATDASASSPGVEHIAITPAGSRPATNGGPSNFTGSVTVAPLFAATKDTRAAGAAVTFEPGARSAWHSHPAGQTLIVTAGAGWVQEWGGTKREMKPGDIVWTPPGVKHWHGATATDGLTHIAIQEHVNGKVVTWMEHVTEDEYRK